jgi:Ca2+-binding RTX toxin-like protein
MSNLRGAYRRRRYVSNRSQIESLEQRQLRTIAVNGTVLEISLEPNQQDLAFSTTGEQTDLLIHGVNSYSFTASTFSTISITGNALDNRIDLSSIPLGWIGSTAVSTFEGNDTVIGSMSIDNLLGGSGDDILLGGGNADVVSGEDGFDILIGNAGSDDLDGGHGDDSSFGNNGNDSLDGGQGNDDLVDDAIGTTMTASDGSHLAIRVAENVESVAAIVISADDLAMVDNIADGVDMTTILELQSDPTGMPMFELRVSSGATLDFEAIPDSLIVGDGKS